MHVAAVLSAQISIARLERNSDSEAFPDPEFDAEEGKNLSYFMSPVTGEIVSGNKANWWVHSAAQIKVLHQHPVAVRLRTGSVLAYSVVLASEHYPSSAAYDHFTDITYRTLSSFFVADELLWIAGEGKSLVRAPEGFKKRAWQWAEATTSLLTFLDAWMLNEAAFVGLVLVVRAAKVFMTARSIKALEPLRVLVKAVGKTLGATVSFIQLLALLVYILALLGMHLFGGKFDTFDQLGQQADAPPAHLLQSRANFDNLFQAILSVFQVLTLEWVGIAYTAMESTSEWAIIYFVVCLVAGNLLMLNLFLAVLIDAVVQQEDELKDSLDSPKQKGTCGKSELTAEKRFELIKNCQVSAADVLCGFRITACCQAISARLRKLGYDDIYLGGEVYTGDMIDNYAFTIFRLVL